VPAVKVPRLERWAEGNTGLPYVWSFRASAPGPHVCVQALTHGNELCGAIAVHALLREGLRPRRGTLSFVFANVAAFARFDPADPYASRCVEEDFNRLWAPEVLDDDARYSVELARARVLRPFYDTVDYLLDLHSMTEACPPLALAGRHPKGLALARAVGIPEHVVIDRGHAAGTRLRDYAFFDAEDDPRSALLVECGQHWDGRAPAVAHAAAVAFLAHLGVAGTRDDAGARPPSQRVIEVTSTVTIESDHFAFARPVRALDVVPRAGTLLARDGDRDLVTPYDNCVLIMPARRPGAGETAVRLGRYLA